MTANPAAQNPCLLSIVVPAYNEEKKIAADLEMLFGYLARRPYRSEVIVVDDGSADKTRRVLESLRPRYPDLKVVSYLPNRGKGYAVKMGVHAAGGDFVLFVDAGNCVPLSEMEAGLELLRDGSDVAIGSRALPESRILQKQRRYRQIGGKLFWYVVRYFLGIRGIADTQCGFKLFRRDAARRLFSMQRIRGFMFDVEWILNAQKLGLAVREFPVQWRSDMDSRFKPLRGSWRILFELARIKLNSL